MPDRGGSTAAPPQKESDGEAHPGKKPLPPVSVDITNDSATGTSNTYTDYSSIPFGDGSDGGSDDAGGIQGENFVLKLHRILSQPDLAHVISWMDHGRAWKVHRPDAFASIVIPEYYNHNKYTSFSRQVNGWGFRRIGSGKDHTAYYHELFLRGKPHLVQMMCRPGPVPPKKDEGQAGGKTSKIGRRRRTTADKGNEPDFHALAEVRPLPVANPPGFAYASAEEEGGGEAPPPPASQGVAATAAVLPATTASRPDLMGVAVTAAAVKKTTKQKRVTSDSLSGDVTEGVLGSLHDLVSDSENSRKKRATSGSDDGVQIRSNALAATQFGGVAAGAGPNASRGVGVGVVPGGSDHGGLGDGGCNNMMALLDQQAKLVESRSDDVTKGVLRSLHDLVSDSEKSRRKEHASFSDDGVRIRSIALPATQFGGGAGPNASRGVGIGVVPGGSDRGGLGDGEWTMALLDQQMKLVEMQKSVIAQMQRKQELSDAQGMTNAGWGVGPGGSAKGFGTNSGGAVHAQNLTNEGALMAQMQMQIQAQQRPPGTKVDLLLPGVDNDPPLAMEFEPDPLRPDGGGVFLVTGKDVGGVGPDPGSGGTKPPPLPPDDFERELDELAGFLGLPPPPGGGAEIMPTMTEEDPVPVPYSAPPPAPSWGGFKLPFDMAAAPGTVVAGSIATGQMQMQHHHHTFPVAKAFAVDFRAANTSFDPVPIAASKQQGLGFDLGMNAMGHMKVMGHT